jgi:hypothetical protein
LNQGSIAVSNSCINLLSLFSISFSFLLFLLNGSLVVLYS